MLSFVHCLLQLSRLRRWAGMPLTWTTMQSTWTRTLPNSNFPTNSSSTLGLTSIPQGRETSLEHINTYINPCIKTSAIFYLTYMLCSEYRFIWIDINTVAIIYTSTHMHTRIHIAILILKFQHFSTHFCRLSLLLFIWIDINTALVVSYSFELFYHLKIIYR